MLVWEGGKVKIDDEPAWEYFIDFFEGEGMDRKYVRRCIDRFYERMDELKRRLIEEFGSLEKTWEEYNSGDRERIEKIYYEFLDEILEEVLEEIEREQDR